MPLIFAVRFYCPRAARFVIILLTKNGGVKMKIKLMIVDDDEEFLASLGAYFAGKSDYEVTATATNGEEALDKLRSADPDVILLDIVMAAAGRLRRARKTRFVPPRDRDERAQRGQLRH